ncbi:hypothetical protein [Azonexus fungiphilus]|uniref:hypothetical protein n=1 Tax=Azonexus fungiphilus TaxID=146940 RepID=UPI001FE45883|nr:hypothetical protein [Azonexus fungiphilus]
MHPVHRLTAQAGATQQLAVGQAGGFDAEELVDGFALQHHLAIARRFRIFRGFDQCLPNGEVERQQTQLAAEGPGVGQRKAPQVEVLDVL